MNINEITFESKSVTDKESCACKREKLRSIYGYLHLDSGNYTDKPEVDSVCHKIRR